MGWMLEVLCLKCKEFKRTKKHFRCTSYCTMESHQDICPQCEKKLIIEFSRQFHSYRFIRVEEEDGA